MHEERPFHDGTETVWAAERSRATPYHFSEGVKIYVAEFDVNPDDQFLTPRSEIQSAEPDSD